MKTLKKLGCFSLSAVALLVLVACGDSVKYEREDDAEVYARVLGDYDKLAAAAKKIDDDDARFVKYAEAEAALLDAGVFNPTTTQGGNYAITRVAPRTIPYADWGNDEDRLKTMVVVDGKNFIKSEERAEMISLWEAARKGGAAYDAKAYLTGKGYTFKDTYQTTYTTAPATLDVLNTSEQSDTEVLVNCIDGLMEYNNLGELKGNLAVEDAQTGLPYELSADGKTYTFTIRDDANWYTANGDVYAKVTADDFVAGFQHMLDSAAGLEFLVQGVVVNADEYLSSKCTFADVGVKADGQKFSITLINKESFFPTRLTYSCFMPMNRAFFLSKGGAFGISEFKEASAKDSYTYGVVADNGNMVYNGAFLPSNIVEKSVIELKANDNYFNKAANNFKSLKWIYDDGSNPEALYNATCEGTYAGVGLGEASGLLAKAKADGNYDKYHYITDTTTTTYLAGYNVNRGTFVTGSVKSTQKGQNKVDTHNAMQNKWFRKALQFAWDREGYNAVSVGEELAALSLRNIYTKPTFLSLGKDVTAEDGHKFTKGTTYGELVQYFCDKAGFPIKTEDGQDGWYNEAKAKEYIAKAVEELTADGKWPSKGKIMIDVTYYGASKSQTAQANAYKASIEKVLGDYVTVCLNDAATTQDFYAAGYRASSGEAGNFDVFYGSGWGPDYGDPSTYLDTFLGDGAGYMTKIIGLF